MLMTFFAVWCGGQNGGQIRGYAYYQVVDAMTEKEKLATATHFKKKKKKYRDSIFMTRGALLK